jgi:hypothetical protein
MNEYEVNQFGEAHLIIEKKNIRRGVTCFGTIQAIERKYILFKDNEDCLYLCDKKDFQFTKKEKI